MSFESKNSLVRGRQLKVQKLSIPFVITSSATPSAVILRCDEPNVLSLRSEGSDQITSALAAGETATYTTSPVDANGTLNMFVKIQPEDSCFKVCKALAIRRTDGSFQPVSLGSASGISSAGNIMLTLDSTVSFASASLDACLEVEYIVVE